MRETAAIPDVLRELLRRFVRRRSAMTLCRGAAEAVLVGVSAFAAVALADALLAPGRGVLTVFSSLAWLSVVVVFAARGLLPGLRRPPLARAARELEMAFGGDELEERLSSAVELAASSPQGVSAWMINRTVALAARDADGLDPKALVDARPSMKRAAYACGLLVLAAVACLFHDVRAFALRALLPGSRIPRPWSVRLDVSPGDCRLSEGSSVVIAAETTPPADKATLRIKWDDGVSEDLPMKRIGQARFAYEIPALTMGFSYYVLVPGAESFRYRVSVAPAPRVRSVELRIRPPTYTGMKERVVTGGDAEVLAGSEVEIRAAMEGPRAAAASAVFSAPEAPVVQPMLIEDGLARLSFRPETSVRWRLRLVGADGLVSETPRDWEIKLVPDALPSVGLSLRQDMKEETDASDGPIPIGQNELLLLDVEAEDDVGLRSLELVARTERPRDYVRKLPFEASPARLRLPVALGLEELDAKLGAEIELFARATDLGGQTAEGRPLRFVVTSDSSSRAAAAAARLRAILKRLRTCEETLKREHRTWLELAKSARPEEPQAHAGAILVGRSRLAELASEAAGFGEKIRLEALEDRGGAIDEVLGRALLSIGDALTGWARANSDAFEQAVRLALESGKGLSSGAGILGAAAEELLSIRSKLGIAVARLQAEALVGSSEAASSRLSRTVPIVRGYRSWDAPASGEGMVGRFFPNVQLSPPCVFETTMPPDLTNFEVPLVGAQNWSVRYSGELLVRKDGRYVFTCVADDGVRLRIAGNTVIDAWKDQPPTTYTAIVELRAGWVPVELEMYQRGGGSRLWFGWAPEGSPARLPDLADLRHSPAEEERRTLAQLMSSLPRGLLERADENLLRDFKTLSAVPETIAQMADDSGIERLGELSRRQQGAAAILRELLTKAQAAGWTELELKGASSYVGPLLWAARTARDILREALGRFEVRRGGIAEIRKEVERALRYLETSSAESAVLASAFERMSRRLDEEESRLSAEASKPEVSPQARSALLEAERVLQTDAERALQKASEALNSAPDPNGLRQRLEGPLRELDGALQRAESAVARAEESRLAELARDVLSSSAELAEKRQSHDALGEWLAYNRLTEQTGDLADAMRQMGRFDQAERLEQLVGDRPSEVDRAALERELNDLASRAAPPQGPRPDIQKAPEALAAEAARMAQRLRELREELAQAEAKSAEARREFADAETRIAQTLGELAAETREALGAIGDRELAATAQKVASELPEEASRASELARRAEGPQESGATNAELARAARERAEAISQGLARPLAEALLASSAKQLPPPVSELGRELAGLAAEQRQAAELLEEASERVNALRRALAEENLAAGLLLAELAGRFPEEGLAPSPAASDALGQQQEADRLQRAANEAQQRANALHEEARRLSEEASQARYEAQNLGRSSQEREGLLRQALDKEQASARALGEALASERQAIAAQEAANDLAGRLQGPPESLEALAQAAAAAANMSDASRNAQQAAELARSLAHGGHNMQGAEAEAFVNASRAAEALGRSTERAPASAEELSRRLAELAARAQAAGGREGQAGQEGTARAEEGQGQSQAESAARASDQTGGLQQEGASGTGQRRGRELGQLAGFDAVEAGPDQAEWARLPEQAIRAIRSGSIEKFAEEYREAIRAYFKRLGEER